MSAVRSPLNPSCIAPISGRHRLNAGVRAAITGLCLVALGLFLGRGPLALCVVAVVGTTGLVLLLLHPVMALYLLAFSVPFGSLYELKLGAITVGASELLVWALVTAWALRMMAFRRVRVAWTGLAGALLCYLGALVVSLWPATSLIPALKELAKWVEFLLVYLFVASELGQTQSVALTSALLLAGTIEGLLGIYQFLYQVGPPGFVLFGRYMRAYGTFLQPNPFAGYMGLLLPLAYTTVFRRWKDVPSAFRRHAWGPALLWVLALVASVVMFAGLVMSWSRGALVGFLAGLALVGLGLGRRVAPALVGLALVLVLLGPVWLGVLPESLIQRLTDVLQYRSLSNLMSAEVTDDNFAVIERAAHWYAAWRMFEQRPWLGVGTGQYATVYPSVSLPRWQDPLGHAHNYYLNILAEGGLVGLVTYLVFLLCALGITWRSAAQGRGWQRVLALAALGMLGHLLTHSAFDNLYVHEMYLLVAMLLSMAASAPRQQSIYSEVV